MNSKVTGRTDGTVHHPGNTFSIDRTLAANLLDAGLQRPIEYRKVPERRNCDRTLAASDQLIVALTVGRTGRIWLGHDQLPVSSKKARFHPQRLLSQWGL